MSGPFGSSQWMYASGAFYGHEISNSLRFNDGDNPSLTFTPSSASNRRTWTWSGWIKRGNLVDGQGFINAGNAPSMGFHENKGYYTLTGVGNSFTSALFRDTSAWYNVVIAFDSTESSAGDRVKYYVNGTQHTMSANHISTNAEYSVNNTVEHSIGVSGVSGSTTYFDGYMAEVNFIDGTALTPASFGETKNDIWIPKDTSGLTFGTNGFRLEFKQTGTGTASSTTIGADTSGNDNHWTSNNLVASDVTIDSPTNNFATLNPLLSDPSYPVTYSEGNLKSTQTNKYFSGASTIAITKEMGGKWYFEAKGISSGNFPTIGVMPTDKEQIPNLTNTTGSSLRYTYQGYDGTIWHGSYSSYGNSFDQDIIGVAFDWDNKKIYFSKNGTWQNSSNPADGTNPAFSSMTDGDYYFYIMNGAGASDRDQIWEVNFGQNGTFSGTETSAGNADDNDIGDFLYDVPAGYLALCTANLPDPVIDPAQGGVPSDYFTTITYTGTGSSNTFDIGLKPAFVWSKARSAAAGHTLYDIVRGDDIRLDSGGTNADQTISGALAFESNGYTLNNNATNELARTFVNWNWRGSDSTSSNTDGSITSTVSVNQKAGFSVVGWTGTGSAATVGHGLGVAPNMVIVKPRDIAQGWSVWHSGLSGGTYYLSLNTTDAQSSASSVFTSAPSSTVFNVGSDLSPTSDLIAYCFANVDGMQKIGSYIGNSNADGSFIFTGFRVAWLLIKKINSSDDWAIHDNKRVDSGTNSNPIDDYLKPNLNYAEEDNGASVDFLSNGFKWRINSGLRNNSGDTYIFMAFAEQPFKYANAR